MSRIDPCILKKFCLYLQKIRKNRKIGANFSIFGGFIVNYSNFSFLTIKFDVK